MSLAEAARKYYDVGLNVVPVKIYRDAGGKWIKKPIMDYSDLHHRRQTREEFQCIDWSAADGIALICGRETEKGFFCAIDIDLPYDEALYKLKTFLKFKITRMEKTVSNRLHLLYFSERPVPSLKLENCPLELLGRGRIVVVYPSKGYEALNDNHPSILEDAFTFFLELAKHFGFDVEDRLIGRAGAREDEAKLAEWLEIILGSGKLEVLGRGPNYYYIRCPFHPPDQHPSFALNHRKFYAIDYHDASIYSLKELAAKLGIRLEQERPRVRYVLGGEVLGDGRVIEIVENDGALKLLVYDPSANAHEICDSLRIENVEYRPYADLPFKEYLPGIPEAISEDPELWRDTLEFIREYYDNPRNDDVYHVMTAVVAWSYFCDVVKGSTPYLCFLGPFRSGKTRALEVMAALCYKPMLAVDPSEASMFRIIEEFRPTLIIDETQIVDKNVRAVMTAGYRFGVKVPRVVDPEADGLETIRWYDVFGLKIYACREEPPSDIFSRSIIIHCEKNVRHTKKKIDAGKAKELQTRWLAQRLRMLNKITVTFEEFQSEDGRLQELFSPLIVMAQHFGGQEAAAAIERYGRQMEREIQAMESTSDDALIIMTLIELINEKRDDAPEVITNREIVEKLNEEYPDAFSPEYVGKRLVALGFERTRLHGGKVAYKIDYELLARLAKRYNINLSLEAGLEVNGEGCTLFG